MFVLISMTVCSENSQPAVMGRLIVAESHSLRAAKVSAKTPTSGRVASPHSSNAHPSQESLPGEETNGRYTARKMLRIPAGYLKATLPFLLSSANADRPSTG